jgi:hypothetical protein
LILKKQALSATNFEVFALPANNFSLSRFSCHGIFKLFGGGFTPQLSCKSDAISHILLRYVVLIDGLAAAVRGFDSVLTDV